MKIERYARELGLTKLYCRILNPKRRLFSLKKIFKEKRWKLIAINRKTYKKMFPQVFTKPRQPFSFSVLYTHIGPFKDLPEISLCGSFYPNSSRRWRDYRYVVNFFFDDSLNEDQVVCFCEKIKEGSYHADHTVRFKIE